MNNPTIGLLLGAVSETAQPPALICFAHLRWDFVLQRPQHLIGRFARARRVLFWEEAIPTSHHLPYLEFYAFPGTTVQGIRPRLPDRWSTAEQEAALPTLLDQMLGLTGIHKPVLWFYTPMMWPIARHVDAAAVVYDCMDDLSAFRFAPPELKAREAALLQASDVVFTGGLSLWEARKGLHDNIHPFPSSVDVPHFARARETAVPAAPEVAELPKPRLGYYGVIDERLDLGLVAWLAAARPDWSIVMVGPLAKLSPANLPQAPNLHWLGPRDYAELPALLAGWDVALMPFALNESTRFISPTKTPEYLAGARPVVSTPVHDVVRGWGHLQAVHVAPAGPGFLAACEAALAQSRDPDRAWRDEADTALASSSWDSTFRRMSEHVAEAVRQRGASAPVDRFPTPGLRRGARAYDVTICGAGFAGAVMAERLAEASGQRVLVVDRRPHVAGNAYDHRDAAGILVHRYGPHIFHTNSDDVVDYLSRFTAWRPYAHRVLAQVGDQRVPMPINRTTLNALYALDLRSDAEAEAFLKAQAQPVDDIRTSRDVVVNAVGPALYETFFQGYTRKQWGLDPSELDKSVTARVPTRTNTDDRYFTDKFQSMPRDGFTRMFESMLDHPRIDLALGTDFHDLPASDRGRFTVYTGPIDAYYGQRFGALPYRSLQFRHKTHDCRRFQEVAVVNYPAEDVPWTRITEYKHLTGQLHPQTSISYEIPSAEGDPYYPIPREENQALYRRYDVLAAQERDVLFLGRLGSYRYYNMDQVVGQALMAAKRLAPRLAEAELACAAPLASSSVKSRA